MEEDGFTLVLNKRCLKVRKLPKVNYSRNEQVNTHEDVDLKAVIRKIQQLQDIIQLDPQCMDILSQLRKVADDQTQYYDQIVAYGLGRISSCRTSRIQAALLLILKIFLNIPVESYDPAFSHLDKEALNYFGIKVLNVNEKCMRNVKGKKIIFYMPHCDLPLYNNLLWTNWSYDNLACITIIGNSFSKVVFNCDIMSSNKRKQLQIDFKYVHLAKKLCSEFILPSKFYPEALNDTAIITFPKQFLVAACITTWEENDPPVIQESDKFVL